jgi:hypothetical protein
LNGCLSGTWEGRPLSSVSSDLFHQTRITLWSNQIRYFKKEKVNFQKEKGRILKNKSCIAASTYNNHIVRVGAVAQA